MVRFVEKKHFIVKNVVLVQFNKVNMSFFILWVTVDFLICNQTIIVFSNNKFSECLDITKKKLIKLL